MRTGYSLLYRRQGIYRFRRVVPKELREIIGQREIKVSLRTADLVEAKRRAARETIKADQRIAEARRILSNPAARTQRIVQEHFEDHRRRPRTDDEVDAESMALTDALEREDDPVRIRAFRTILKKIREDDDGTASGENPLLSTVFDRWQAERQPPARTWMEWTKARERFERVTGGDLPVREITKGHVRAFKAALMETTARNGDTKLSPASITKNLTALRSVLSWAVGQGYLEDNPATGITHAGAKRAQWETRRLPYDSEDLKKLFSQEAVKARKATTPASHWLPFLALYTGARLEELGQLRTADVRREDGVDFIAIEAGEGRRVKNPSSQRRVPLHPELLRLGFLDYVGRQRDAGATRLFPDLKAPAGRPLTAPWSKWWGRHARKHCGIQDKRKVFHSLRHAFIDAARLVMEEEHRNAITGHASASVGRGYGTHH
jgi:integrase